MCHVGYCWRVPTDELITVSQAATILGKSVRTVHRMAAAGTLPSQKLAGAGPAGAYLFSRQVVEVMARLNGKA